VSGSTASQRAVATAWLCPSVASLAALTADPPDRSLLLRDPAVVAHILRFARPTPDPDTFWLTAVLTQPSICTSAAELLEHVDPPEQPAIPLLQRLGDLAASAAFELAERSGLCSPDAAACAARLVPLGWYAVAATNLGAALVCLNDPDHVHDPLAVQQRHWGLDAVVIGRRLAGRWRLPPWVTATIGFLRLSAEDAARLGVPDGIYDVVRAAIRAAERRVAAFGLSAGSVEDDRLFAEAVRILDQLPEPMPVPQPEPAPRWLLMRLLRTTAQARRATGAVWLAEAEARVDQLTETLGTLRGNFDEAVRAARLDSMAEFAAGASHEINNPLAVISGHAQLLLTNEDVPERRKQLESIVRQTRRVHELLQGTLQFARPSRPSRSVLRLNDWLAEVVAAYRDEAKLKEITLELSAPRLEYDAIAADRGQLKQALGHLVRNAIEATPSGGTITIHTERRGDEWAICVEDSGHGPQLADVPRLFDPFFSGRSAGRGRGLGLSIAWRYARLNGGDVRYEPRVGGPTRFVLTLPQHHAAPLPERMSA